MESTRIQTAKAFIAAYSTLSVEAFLPLLADDYTHTFAPASLGRPTPKTKSEFAAQMSSLRGVLRGISVHVKEAIDSASSNRVVIWATGETAFRDEAKDAGLPDEEWRAAGEYVFMFTMDEGGARVARLVEFVDSKSADRVMGLVVRARKNVAERQNGA